MTDYFIHFVHTLDPNGGSEDFYWPEYIPRSPKLLAFVDGDAPLQVVQDTFRKEPIKFVNELSLAQPS